MLPIHLMQKHDQKSNKLNSKTSKCGSLEVSFPHTIKNSQSTKRLNRQKKTKNSSLCNGSGVNQAGVEDEAGALLSSTLSQKMKLVKMISHRHGGKPGLIHSRFPLSNSS